MHQRENLGFQPGVLALWLAGSLLFVVALYGSARLGIRLAEEHVPPESVAPGASHDVGIDVEAEGRFVLAATQRELREYYFREETTAGTGIGGKGSAEVIEYEGHLVVHTVATDLDLVRVEIVSGPGVGRRYWMRAALLGDDPDEG